MRAQLLLCDHAQVAEGKLFINGGGIDTIRGPMLPPGCTVAIHLQIPWDRGNDPLDFVLELLTEDGESVASDENGLQIRFQGVVEVGRPPGLKPGTSLTLPLAVPVGGIQLPAGRYEWRLRFDGKSHETWQQTFTIVN